MELVPIFVDGENSAEGLFAVRYDENTSDELSKLFEKWTDSNIVFSYLLFNEEYLKDQYFDNYSTPELSEKIEEEAIAIYSLFKKYKEGGYKVNSGFLQKLFQPLQTDIKQFREQALQKAKLKLDKDNYPQSILRLYGLRIGENTFVITGGAIKLTHWMQDHPDTRDELAKLEFVEGWLIENDVTSHDDIKFSYYE